MIVVNSGHHSGRAIRLCPVKRIRRAALAPVPDKTTGASALRLIYETEPRLRAGEMASDKAAASRFKSSSL